MDFELTEEQTWLAESVAELLARRAGDDGIVPPEAADAVWKALVEFGATEVGTTGDRLGAVELAQQGRGAGKTGGVRVGLGNRIAVDGGDGGDQGLPGIAAHAIAVAGDHLAALPATERQAYRAIQDAVTQPSLEQHPPRVARRGRGRT